jgi:hypothetical protein
MNLETKKVYKNKKSNPLYLSVLFFIFSTLLTLGIYLYNISIIDENEGFSTEISIKESSIAELEKDSNIIISGLYNSNKNSIKRLREYSNITLFINHISNLSRLYKIDFK